MGDSFTETTTQGWFSRIGGSIKGILFGILLCIIGVPLLFWNEGRAVKRHKTLKEGAGAVVAVSAEKVDSANEGKLVHLSGLATTAESLADEKYGITAEAIRLRRTVEMYQWEERTSTETKKKLGGKEETTTTYNYDKVWSSGLIDSSKFKRPAGHTNPKQMPVQSSDQQAGVVTVGAFTLTASQVGGIEAWEDVPVPPATEMPADLRGQVKIANGGYYLGMSPLSPRVGDVRISFQKVPPTTVSIVSKQVKGTFEPYTSKVGGKLELLKIGEHSAETMFEEAEASNKMMTWFIRLGGFLCIFIGFTTILRPFRVVADVVPFIGNIVGMGVGFVSFIVAAIISLIVIAVAWIFYRPLLAGILIAIVVGLIVLLVMKRKKAKAAALPPVPA